jgi:NAD(P)-dependent dehydrogenase (short-subunit alcohol dehydrogenase family)
MKQTSQPKIALVTGGSRGLGRSMAEHLAAHGHDVIITYQTKEEDAKNVVASLQAGGRRAAALRFDAGDTGALDAFVGQFTALLQREFGRDTFDILINNAGMGATIPYAMVTEGQLDEFFNVHFKSVFLLTQKTLPYMAEGGRIINISSGTTRFANPGYSVYASMKAAIEVFTRYLAKEVGNRGITANVVAPGPIETDFNNAAIRSNPGLKGMLANVTALGRVGEADDIGGLIALLCSEEARWVTGQRIEASGGINL